MIKIIEHTKLSDDDIILRNAADFGVSESVAEIVKTVRERGDIAVRNYTERFDGVLLTDLELSAVERQRAMEEIEPEFLAILKEVAENIRNYHSRQKITGYEITEKEGIVLGQRVMPLERVGLYVPGGTASYPSTVLMNCIPAKIAGVREIIMTTPPDKTGNISQAVVAAAGVAGVDRIFKCGGAQAVAALAFGTESVPAVDKIVGPGNAYVAEAKRQVFGVVSIDMIAGPSEILVISDGSADPAILAADMLSQAEHDRQATAVLITVSAEEAVAVAEEIERQLAVLPRESIARMSIENNGKIIIADSIEQAIEISNKIAPEHLELCIDEPMKYLNRITHAGSVFLGKNCPEALGDYFAGTNHTLPTGGTARFSSPLSVDDFVKKSSYMYYTDKAFEKVGGKIAYFAEQERLSGHARSVLIRLEKRECKQ